MKSINLRSRKGKSSVPQSPAERFDDLAKLISDMEGLQADLSAVLAYASIIDRDPHYERIPKVVKCLEVATGSLTVALSHGRSAQC